MMRIGILVPCYNVSTAGAKLLESFSEVTMERVYEVLVIDNRSTDDTVHQIRSVARSSYPVSSKIKLIRNAENYGLGGTQKVAFQYFLANDFTHFMIIHGDNQGDGEEIAYRFLLELDQYPESDLIVASRSLAGSQVEGYSPLRQVGNVFFSLLTRLSTGVSMSDSGAGILLARAAAIKDLPFAELSDQFHFNPQLNILMYGQKKYRIREVPLSWKDSEVESNVDTFKYCATLSKILAEYWLRRSLLGKKDVECFGSRVGFRPRPYDVVLG